MMLCLNLMDRVIILYFIYSTGDSYLSQVFKVQIDGGLDDSYNQCFLYKNGYLSQM